MRSQINLRTRDIIAKYLKVYTGDSEFWTPEGYRKIDLRCEKSERYHEELTASVSILLRVAQSMREFIENSHKERFDAMTQDLINRAREKQQIPEPAFEAIADELFVKGISWSRIVTFLVYFSEVISDFLCESQDTLTTDLMVDDMISWMCKYIDKNLLQWINQHDGKWKSLAREPIYQMAAESPKRKDSASENGNFRNSKRYIGFAACAILLGSLYMCSKLTVQ